MLQVRHVRAEERHGDHVGGVLDQHAGVAMVGMVVIGPWSHDNIRIPLADEPGDEPAQPRSQPDVHKTFHHDLSGELRAAGLAVNVDQVIAMKVQDVSPSYLKGLHDQGIEPTAENVIAMRVQDVTPEYVREIRALGLNPSAMELIAMRVQDVTPEYIKALQAAGYKLSVNDIIGAKVQDVTPEFIERAQKHGFKDLTLQKLIQLRQLGILDSKSDL